MIRIHLALIGALTWAGAALAQPVSIVGPVTPGNCPAFSSTTVLRDSGTPCGSNIFASNNTWTGTNTFVNPAFLPFLPATLWGNSFVQMGNVYSATYQATLNVNQVVPLTADVFPAYEAIALFVNTRTSDPSNVNSHDSVSIDVRASIAAGNANGRTWPLFNQCIIEVTADGVCFGQETSVENHGTSQPVVGTITSKYNINLTTAGNPSTAALHLDASGPGWHNALWTDPASLSGAAGTYFVNLVGKWTVAKTGFTAIGGTTLTAHPVGVQAESTGGFAIAIQGRAADGIGSLNWYSNDLGTLYASLVSNSSSQLLSSSTFAPSDNGLRNLGLSANAWLGVYVRNVIINGSAAQSVTQTAQATAGNATVTWGTASGTPAVTATSPLAIATATGNITLSLTTTACTNQFVSAISAVGVGTCSTVALTALATQATNTVLGNATAGTAVPTALAVGTCSTAASALIWTTNTGFGCNTSITAATLSAVLGPALGGTGVANNAASTTTISGNFGLTFTIGAARNITVNGNPTLNDWFDQSVKTSASPTFVALTTTGALTVQGTTLVVGSASALTAGAINGSSSGTGGGAYFSVQNGGSGVIAFGNASAILGGAYDATGIIFTGAASFKAYVNGAYNFQVTNSQFAVLVTTDATSTSTGAFQNPGGMSVNKRVWMNGLSAASAGLSAACVENTGEITTNTGVTTCLVSAREWKTNIRALPDGSSNLLMAMRPRLFDWRNPDNGAPDHIGFIADEVASVDARLGVKGRVLGKDGVWSSWRVEIVTTLLVQGYQQHEDKLKNLQADNDNLRAEVEQLKRVVSR